MIEPVAVALALLLIAVLITIHELGHFLVAKALGVDVKVFSIGIGGRAFGVFWKGTDYRVSWFPFGGYVRMAGADPFMEGGADEDDDPRSPGAFMSKAPWKRLLIVLAGPVMNLLLPFVVFTALYVAGDPQPRSDLGMVHPGTAAEAAGLRPEDRVLEVDGVATTTWYDVTEAFEVSTGDGVTLLVERAGERVTVELPVAGVDLGETRDPYDFGLANSAPDPTVVVDDPASPAARAGLASGDVLASVGGQPVRDWNEVRRIAAGFGDSLPVTWKRGEEQTLHEGVLRADPAWSPVATEADDALWRAWGVATATVSVERVEEDSAARAAGIVAGDRVVRIDERPVRSWLDVTQSVAAAATGEPEDLATRPIRVTLRRDGVLREVLVTPRVVRDTDELGRYRWRPLLGIGGGGAMVAAPQISRPYPLDEAFVRATRDTTMVAGFIVEQIGKFFTNEAAVSESLGGPVEIFRQTKAAAELGIKHWARQLGLFSISLGVINLLPVPVLDGGQLMMYLAEWVRGRPLPLVLRERAQQVGVIFLVLLMLFVLVNDIHRAATG
ncbi:MAG: site-2 protease family protein [Myxococcota bacterium]